jgi:FdhD protein
LSLTTVPEGQHPALFSRIAADPGRETLERPVADETPVAIEINGAGYAVLMASPVALDDLVFGFLSGERLIQSREEILGVDVWALANGSVIARTNVASAAAARLGDRVRHRAADSSCGLCGVESLEQALRELPRIPHASEADDRAVFAALKALPGFQPLNRMTGAVHAAALCDAQGKIRLVREDVGRHNAFDKLIGAMMRQGLGWDRGFALLSSRCSYELVEKAVLSGCPMLVTISAPTGLALKRASDAGLDLRVLARSDAILSPVGQAAADRQAHSLEQQGSASSVWVSG